MTLEFLLGYLAIKKVKPPPVLVGPLWTLRLVLRIMLKAL